MAAKKQDTDPDPHDGLSGSDLKIAALQDDLRDALKDAEEAHEDANTLKGQLEEYAYLVAELAGCNTSSPDPEHRARLIEHFRERARECQHHHRDSLPETNRPEWWRKGP